MYGSYLLDKNRWPLVFECVKAMTIALKEKKDSCDSDKGRNKVNDDEKEEKEEEDSAGIPLLCKIRICEDGVDSYKATEDFCRGTVSYRTVR